MTSDQIIDQLPYVFQSRLQADSYFANIPVIVADEGNIKLQVQRRTAAMTSKGGKRGVAVIVLQLLADDSFASLPLGPMTLSPSFQVVEQVEINRGANGTGVSARQVARRIRDVIKGFVRVGMFVGMRPGSPCIVPVNLKEELGENVRAYQVDFHCLEATSVVPTQVAMPAFVNLEPAPQVGLICATQGAQIYYTLDESYPWSGNRAAVLYAGPIAVPATGAIVVTACAYLPGVINIASAIIRETVMATQLTQG